MNLASGLVIGFIVCVAQATEAAPTIVYEARKIVTMNPATPVATRVAVSDGRIVAVGSAASVKEALAGREVRFDDRFKEKVLLPGFIESHSNLLTVGLLLPMEFITQDDWDLPGKQVKGVRGRNNFLKRLREVEAQCDSEGWLDTWGFDQEFHGNISREDLDEISVTRPILVWHRSSREIVMNTPALDRIGITEAKFGDHSQIDVEQGRIYDHGLAPLAPSLINRLLTRERFKTALHMAREIIHAGGVTTVGNSGFASLGFDQEFDALKRAGFDSAQTPFRSVLLIDGTTVGAHMSHAVTREWIESLPARATHRLIFPAKAVKLYADEDVYRPLNPLRKGELIGSLDEQEAEEYGFDSAARLYWNYGFRIHVEAQSEHGLETALEVFESLSQGDPQEGQRIVIEEVSFSNPDQVNRIATLDAMVSANLLAISSLAEDHHALEYAEGISVDDALRAITINAARQLGMEDEIGSIAVGKRADFAVLEEDPYAVPVEEFREVPIWGTVFEGEPYRLNH